MKEEILKEKLAAILPSRPQALNPMARVEEQAIAEEAQKIIAKQDAKVLAKLKYAETRKLKHLKEQAEVAQAIAEEYELDEVPEGKTEKQLRKFAEQQKKVETIEAIEIQNAEPLSLQNLAKKGALAAADVNRALQLQGTSRPEMLKLLTELNINLSIQLTKNDTANLLACLLTCNETQLAALYANNKVPIAIKAIIKRLQDDARLGEIGTIERLWDRIFGKGQMSLNLPEQAQIETGILPNTPISREAYIVIRDTLIR
jgi:YesN/AraC family two-component response regulator